MSDYDDSQLPEQLLGNLKKFRQTVRKSSETIDLLVWGISHIQPSLPLSLKQEGWCENEWPAIESSILSTDEETEDLLEYRSIEPPPVAQSNHRSLPVRSPNQFSTALGLGAPKVLTVTKWSCSVEPGSRVAAFCTFEFDKDVAANCELEFNRRQFLTVNDGYAETHRLCLRCLPSLLLAVPTSGYPLDQFANRTRKHELKEVAHYFQWTTDDTRQHQKQGGCPYCCPSSSDAPPTTPPAKGRKPAVRPSQKPAHQTTTQKHYPSRLALCTLFRGVPLVFVVFEPPYPSERDTFQGWYLNLIGGGAHEDETLFDSVVRECAEETRDVIQLQVPGNKNKSKFKFQSAPVVAVPTNHNELSLLKTIMPNSSWETAQRRRKKRLSFPAQLY